MFCILTSCFVFTENSSADGLASLALFAVLEQQAEPEPKAQPSPATKIGLEMTGPELVSAVLASSNRYALLSLGCKVTIVMEEDHYLNVDDDEVPFVLWPHCPLPSLCCPLHPLPPPTTRVCGSSVQLTIALRRRSTWTSSTVARTPQRPSKHSIERIRSSPTPMQLATTQTIPARRRAVFAPTLLQTPA